MKAQFKGALSVLLSAFLFYLATLFVKIGVKHGTELGVKADIPGNPYQSIIYLAARFWLGYFFMLFWFPLFKKIQISKIETVNTKWLWYRAFWNLVAVMLFYLSVIFGSLTGANILNMTYPVFVAILSIYVLHEKPDLLTWAGVILSVAGAGFVLLGTEKIAFLNSFAASHLGRAGDIFGLLSAITAALAIIALRIIRLTDTTEAALFYNFRLGFWITLPMIVYYYFFNGLGYGLEGKYILIFAFLSGVSGILGQVALTWGFKYVTAVYGSILSSARLIFAVLIGWIFFKGEVNVFTISGAIFIFLANMALVVSKKNN